MRSAFEDVNMLLSSNEEVLLEIKPNRTRYIFIGNVIGSLLGIFVGAIFFTLGLLILLKIIPSVDSTSSLSGGLVFMGFGALPIVSPIINFFTKFARYKNLAYIVTNNRLIIRSGLIGIDYREMSLNSILSMNVRVDFLDKLVKPNTGVIYFANASAPMMPSGSNGRDNPLAFKFEYIENPYEVYRQIKEIAQIQ